MKTFKTKQIIKEQNMFTNVHSPILQSKKRSATFSEVKHIKPNMLTKGKTKLFGKNDLYSADISTKLSKSKGILFNDGKHSISMIPLTTKSVQSTLSNDKIVFTNFNGVDDIIYSFEENGLKEDIVIKTKRDTYTYKFKLLLTNLVAVLVDDNEILFLDETTKKEVFKMPSLFMEDMSKTCSNAITLFLENDILTIDALSEWINSSARVFPVTIDPSIEVIEQKIISLTNYLQNGNVISPLNGKITVGRNSSANKNYAKFIFNRKTIKNNTDYLKASYVLSFSYDTATLSTTTLGFSFKTNNTVIESGIKFDTSKRYTLDITKYICDSSNSLLEIILELDEPSSSVYGTPINYPLDNVTIYTSDYIDLELRPKLRFEYLSLGEYSDTKTLSLPLSNKDNIDINIFDRKYLYKVSASIIKDGSLSVPINLINSGILRNSAPELYVIKDAYMGGFKTNLHQYLIKKTSQNNLVGSRDTFYIDGDNRSHSLYERWFYITTNGLKTYVDRDNVYLDNDNKLKTKVNTTIYEVKYEVVSDDGLQLISVFSLSDYKKQAKKSIKRTFKLQLLDVLYTLEMSSNGTLSVPHFTADGIAGSLCSRPQWYTNPSSCFDSITSYNDTWKKWDYVDPQTVSYIQASASGTSSSTVYNTHFYSLPVFKDENGYYVNLISRKVTVLYSGSGTHEFLNEAPKNKMYLRVTEENIFDDISLVHENSDLTGIISKIKSIKDYLKDLSDSRTNIEKAITNIDTQIEQTSKDASRFQVQIKLTDNTFGSDGDVVRNQANYSNDTIAVSRQLSLIPLYETRVSYCTQLLLTSMKIDEYSIALDNALEEKEYLTTLQKDNINDLIIDSKCNVLGFDYYGKLIMIQDSFENKIEIEYKEEKLVKVSSSKDKVVFHYDNINGLLDYLIDVKGRKLYFTYNNSLLSKISRHQQSSYQESLFFGYNSNNLITNIKDGNSYNTIITYNNNNLSGIKKIANFVFVSSNYISGSGNNLEHIFDYSFDYPLTPLKITLIDNKNSNETTYTFDNYGRVINEETSSYVTTSLYDNDKLLFTSSRNVALEKPVTETISGSETILYFSISPSNGTANFIKGETIDGKYVFSFKTGPSLSSSNYYVTLKCEIVNHKNTVSSSIRTITYVNPSNQMLVLPIYIPSDIQVINKVRITVTSNIEIPIYWVNEAVTSRSNWSMYDYDSYDRLIKVTSGKETTSYTNFFGDKPQKIVSTNLYDDISTDLLEYNEEGKIVFSKDSIGNVNETYYDGIGRVI
ncbi:MAG: hypothetical protein LBV51_02830, partial [Acholeplasmatales bacterium]|nr:hypothetical protein [Acholeplasmatales bacterium]